MNQQARRSLLISIAIADMKEQYTEPGGQLRFQPAFEQCRRQAFLTVTTNLTELLRHADDALLDFADQAQTNSIQQEFFAARGVILTHRPLVQSLFQTCFNRAFDDLGQRVPLRSSGSNEDDKEELDLSLLSVVEMDENVAVETLVHKAKDRCYTELYALRQRLSVVAGGGSWGTMRSRPDPIIWFTVSELRCKVWTSTSRFV